MSIKTSKENPNPNQPQPEIKCLFCNDCVEVDNGAGLQKTFRCNNGNLQTQLSVFFLSRRVLGLRTEFLESLLVRCGHPSNWNVQLCRQCTRVFKEAEYLFDKIKNIQREYQKVVKEIRSIVTNSETSQIKDEGNGKGVKSKKSLPDPFVFNDIRSEFFKCVADQSTEDIKPPIENASSGELGNIAKTRSGMIHYQSIADFEKTMKQLQDAVGSLSEKCISFFKKDEVPNDRREESKAKDDDDDDDDIVVEMEIEVKKDKNISAPGSSLQSVTNAPNQITPARRNSRKDSKSVDLDHNESDEPEPLIRIVQTKALMETEEEDEEDGDNDAVPHVLGVVKHDINFEDEMDSEDMVIDEVEGDPLENDKTDPDYLPNECGSTTCIRNLLNQQPVVPTPTESVTKPEDLPSKLNSLTIKTLRKGPKAFECSKCAAIFDDRKGCQVHILRDHYNDSKPFHCPCCSAKFLLLHPFNEHVMKYHGCINTPYDDDYDSATTTKDTGKRLVESTLECLDSLERETVTEMPTDSNESHSNSTGNKVKADIKCADPACSKRFTSKRQMHKHAKCVHGIVHARTSKKVPEPDSPSLKCEICAKRDIVFTAYTQDILDIHTKRIHGGVGGSKDKPKITTKIIGKANMSKSSKPQPTMKCPDCGKILPSAAAMVNHIKNPENKCSDCHKHFMFEADLKKHQELDHSCNWQCPYCPKSFSARTIYEKHIANHQSYDSHECEVCREKFVGLAHITQHMQNTHAEFLQQQQQMIQTQDPGIFGI